MKYKLWRIQSKKRFICIKFLAKNLSRKSLIGQKVVFLIFESLAFLYLYFFKYIIIVVSFYYYYQFVKSLICLCFDKS